MDIVYQALSQRNQLVMILGEPGYGKTKLIKDVYRSRLNIKQRDDIQLKTLSAELFSFDLFLALVSSLMPDGSRPVVVLDNCENFKSDHLESIKKWICKKKKKNHNSVILTCNDHYQASLKQIQGVAKVIKLNAPSQQQKIQRIKEHRPDIALEDASEIAKKCNHYHEIDNWMRCHPEEIKAAEKRIDIIAAFHGSSALERQLSVKKLRMRMEQEQHKKRKRQELTSQIETWDSQDTVSRENVFQAVASLRKNGKYRHWQHVQDQPYKTHDKQQLISLLHDSLPQGIFLKSEPLEQLEQLEELSSAEDLYCDVQQVQQNLWYTSDKLVKSDDDMNVWSTFCDLFVIKCPTVSRNTRFDLKPKKESKKEYIFRDLKNVFMDSPYFCGTERTALETMMALFECHSLLNLQLFPDYYRGWDDKQRARHQQHALAFLAKITSFS
jgi:hypothetical protein